MDLITEKLFALKDEKYKEFSSRLLPTIEKDRVIGVKTPILRNLAKELIRDYRGEVDVFMKGLPHYYLEENTLHGILISLVATSSQDALTMLDKFLPYVDNWATCDTISPKIFNKDLPTVRKRMEEWLSTDSDGKLVFESEVYKVRFAVVTMLQFFLGKGFEKEDIPMLAKIKSGEYYINMAIAWYYSFALIKQYEDTIWLFQEENLDQWIHNKSIQKALESRRIADDRKSYLRTLKVK